MLKLFKYSHLEAKIRVMYGNMLKDEDFDKLITQKSVNDIAAYLKKNTYYRKYFEGLDEASIHRGQLEVMLTRSLVTDALKIAKYLKGNEKTIYRFVYRKLEVEDIKKMLRALQQGKPLSSLDRKTLFVSRLSNIDFNVSLKANNVRELMDSLEDTRFYNILKPLVKNDYQIDLFAAEMALDLYYFKRLHEQIDRLSSGKDKNILREAYGLDADFRNLMWIYRAKRFYGIQKEIIYTYLVPGGLKIKKNDLIELIETTDIDDLITKYKRGPYGKYIDFESDHWTNSFYSYFGHKQRMNMRLMQGTIAPIIGYIFIKEIEVMNLTTIIEGVRYHASNDTIEAYLSRL